MNRKEALKKHKKWLWSFFREGDIVISPGSYYDNYLFVVRGFSSTYQEPELHVHRKGLSQHKKFYMMWEVRETLLIDAPVRPLKKLPKKALFQLVGKGHEEARREFEMRKNTQTL